MLDSTAAKIRKLKRSEKEAVMIRYLDLAVEVIKRYGAEEERRRQPRPFNAR